MDKLIYFVNNNGTMEISQEDPNSSVTVHTFHNFDDFLDAENDINISSGDMVMLINLYKYIKDNDVQNDFINPSGKNHK